MSSAPGVSAFYSGKNIFITGGSGFVGVCLLEKIIRTVPNHGEIYLLLRPKRGKQIEERLETLKTNSVFEKLLEDKSVEQLFAKVKAITGDVGAEGLGLSKEDRKFITDNTDIIVHSAATLDFAETLSDTVNVNLLGTRRIAELAKECKKLKALVHISSAYVNSYRKEAEEIIYPTTMDPEELIQRASKLSSEDLEKEAPKILGDHPNSYTITKHMAEHEIKKIETTVPCAIVRPSMIIGSWKEPVPGWTVSKNGPQGFIMGAAKGVIRRLPVRKELVYDYIPVDVVINAVLVAGFHAAQTETKNVEVYHCTSSTRNPFFWAMVEDDLNSLLNEYPLKSAIWYPHISFIPFLWAFKISAIFVHFLPAIILDQLLRMTGGKPILVRMHTNVINSLGRLEKFIFNEWKFHATKMEDLHKWLSSKDQEDYGLSVENLVWLDYFRDLTIGSRIYLNKEPLKNLEQAKRKNQMLKLLHYGLLMFGYGVIWSTFAWMFDITMFQASFIVPLAFIGQSYL